jgi:hypothetical protein
MDASNMHLSCFFLMPCTVGYSFVKVKWSIYIYIYIYICWFQQNPTDAISIISGDFLSHFKCLHEYTLFVVQAFQLSCIWLILPLCWTWSFLMVVPLLLIYFHFNLILRSYNGHAFWNHSYIGILQIDRCLPADWERLRSPATTCSELSLSVLPLAKEISDTGQSGCCLSRAPSPI